MKRAVLTLLLPCVCAVAGLASCEAPIDLTTHYYTPDLGDAPPSQTRPRSLLDPPPPIARQIPAPRHAQYGRDEAYYQTRPYDRPPSEFPVAKRTHPEGYVISPYTKAKIPVKNIPSGARVLDPSSNRVFINP